MSLKEKIISEIQVEGPITIERYMDICLNDNDFGYYSSKVFNIGRLGDFITAPEISQVFGELIGLWLAQTWIDRDSISPFNLVELGPGNGTLMLDILRSVKNVPNFFDLVYPVLVEKSKSLRKKQQSILDKTKVQWATNVLEIPDRPTFVVANEFFDALPIRQFIKFHGLWKERCVGLDEAQNFCFCHKPVLQQNELHALYPNLPDDVYVETNNQTIEIVSSLSEKLAKNNGVFLIIDYGCFGGVGDTLQAVSQHSFANPLSFPGDSDLTAHVNFATIAAIAKNQGLRSTKLCTQRDFLISLGIKTRAYALGSQMSPKKNKMHLDAIDILINKEKMGEVFKIMALTTQNSPTLPVLEKPQ